MASLARLLADHGDDEVDHDAEAAEAAEERAYITFFLEQLAQYAAGGWRTAAACRGMNPDIWHRRQQDSEAVAVCMRCPVIDECRTWIMSLPNTVDGAGVYAGLDVGERRARRKAARDAA